MILAQDPSFKHLAFSILHEDTIYVDMCSVSLGENIGFEKIYLACHELWEQYKSKLDALGVGDRIVVDKIISEFPPPTGQFSPGLFALDTYIFSNLWNELKSANELYVVPSSYLSIVHNTRKYDKGDSTKLAKYFINEVLQDYFEVKIPDSISPKGRKTRGTMNNDRAESFLFLLRMIARYDIRGLRNKIVQEMSGLGVESERLLCSR